MREITSLCTHCGGELKFQYNEHGVVKYWFKRSWTAGVWISLREEVTKIVCNHCGREDAIPSTVLLYSGREIGS